MNQMNTIMTVAYNASINKPFGITATAETREAETNHEPKVRLMYETDNTELHLHDGVQQKLEVIHPVHTESIYNHAEEIIAAQRKVEDACRFYEARINKRPPPDIV
jgi:phage baseplate assembly protein W